MERISIKQSELAQHKLTGELPSSSRESIEDPFYYPKPTPSHVEISFNKEAAQNAEFLKNLTAGDTSFAERMDSEIERLSPLYLALSDWARYDVRCGALKEFLELDNTEYQSLREKHKSITPEIYQTLLEIGAAKGFSTDELIRVAESRNPDQLNIKAMAKMRMLLLKGIMYSNPVFVRDFFDGKRVRTGFGNAKEGVFQHKAEQDGIRFSAIASPRVHKKKGEPESGLVFRYAVAKFDRDGFEEDRAVQMIDGKVCDLLMAWNKDDFQDDSLEKNPLLAHAHRLNAKPIHDHVHSWFLYDASASTEQFLEWGLDIFDIQHLSAKDLLINYEMLVGFMHNVAHRMLEWSNPELYQETITELTDYLEKVEDFTEWLGHTKNTLNITDQDIQETRDYLVYIVASNLCFVHHPEKDEMKKLLAPYPEVLSQMKPRIGDMINFVNSNPQGVPSRKNNGDVEQTGNYILRYPLLEEFQETLRKQQLRELLATGSGVQMNTYSAYRALPENIAEQLEENSVIGNPTVFTELQSALKLLRKDLGNHNTDFYNSITERVCFQENHFFLRISRQEIDFEKMTPRPFSKKALLVQVPKGKSIQLEPRLTFGANQIMKKQKMNVSEGNFVAFNVRDDSHAEAILEKGMESRSPHIDIYKMIAHANELGAGRGVKGAQDIYTLNSNEAYEIYGYENGPGIYETEEIRQAADTVGPIEIKLRSGSTQRTLNGAFIFRAQDEQAFNKDQNPDCWAPEWGAFRATYLDPTGKFSLKPYILREEALMSMANGANDFDSEKVMNAIHSFHRNLREINFQLDFGGFNNLAGDELYTQ